MDGIGREADATVGSSTPEPNGDSHPAIRVRNLTKTYGRGQNGVQAVRNVSFDVAPGQVVGVLGANGAGKTTMIKSMLYLVVPDAGQVELAGVDVHENPHRVYRFVSAMLEGARNVYWKLTVRENLEFFGTLGGSSPSDLRERHDQLLDQLGLAEKADETVNELSRGMKQKVALACALARDVEIAFLDEPTLGLDVESSVELRRELRRLADQQEMTIVLNSHDMDVVQAVCDRVLIMKGGEIIADDTVEDLIDLFRTQTYQVAVHEEMPADARRRLVERFGVTNWGQRGDRQTFEATLETAESFYDLMDVLRATDVSVASVEPVEPDLEEVFLELTEDGGGSE